MQSSDKIRIMHMIDAAKEAMSFAAGRNRKDLDRDRMLVLSLVKSIEILGEAASRISEEERLEKRIGKENRKENRDRRIILVLSKANKK